MTCMRCMIFVVLGTITTVFYVSCCKELDPADDPKYIVRPCPDFELACIRNYFAENSNCQMVQGSIQDPPHIDEYIIKYPNVNITLVMKDVAVKGLYGDIVEFYINMATNKLVLAMRTKTLQLESQRGTMNFHRKGKESISRTDYVIYGYDVVTLTAEFPCMYNLDLNEVQVSSFIEENNPPYKLGPNFSRTSDPIAIREFKEYSVPTEGSLIVRIDSSWHETILMSLFIQNVICDFDKEKFTMIKNNKSDCC